MFSVDASKLAHLSGSNIARSKGKKKTVVQRAKLFLVDLAGSEKWDKSINMGKGRAKELTHINKSLSALGNVIQALTDSNRRHVPYRDSTLTRLLQDALGGNSRTLLVATVSPSAKQALESVSTVKFADRASHITLKVKVNELVDDTVLLKRAQREISRLRSLLKKRGSAHTKKLESDLETIMDVNNKLRAE